MTQATFAEILEATEQLPPEDQEQLMESIPARLK
jgi:hypothetical protein